MNSTTAQETERLRINLLRQLKNVDPMPVSLDALRVGVKMEGFAADERAIAVECEHLADPEVGLIRLADQLFSKAVKRFKLTAKGREWLEGMGF